MSRKKRKFLFEGIEQDAAAFEESMEETFGEVPPICRQLSLRKTPQEKIEAVNLARSLFRRLKLVKCGDLECPVCTKV